MGIWISVLFSCLLSAGGAQASEQTADPSADQLERILLHNQRVREDAVRTGFTAIPAVARPYAEYEPAASLLFSAGFSFDSEEIKKSLVQNLPPGVTAYILAETDFEAENARQIFSQLAKPDRFEVLPLKSGFWARDSLPVPVFLGLGEKSKVGLVDARYYHFVEPDSAIASFFAIPLLQHAFFYEGGNFLTDSKGNCFFVDYKATPSSKVFEDLYGCSTLTSLPFEKGIGHVDEHAKFMSDSLVFTDLPSYAAIFRSKGYQVQLLPEPPGEDETYVNSLLINGSVFVPIYGAPQDVDAVKMYAALGLKVFPHPSNTLSNHGHGSIHCITMTYPALK